MIIGHSNASLGKKERQIHYYTLLVDMMVIMKICVELLH